MPRKPEPPTRSMPVARGRPRLTVIGGGQFSLPVAGRVTIGRDTGCEVRIDDPSISRRHVTIEIGERLTAIDLGSSNGSSWRGKRLIANQAVELVYDEVLTVGAVGVVIQRNSPATRERALWGHGYFELRLAEECTRADRAGTTFGLLRVRAPGDAAGKLSAAVREIDVVGTYAPGEWEVLVIDAERPDVEAVARAIEAAIDGAEVALAMFPADGHDAWTLAAAVTAGLTERARKPAKLDPPRLSTTGPMAALVQLIERVAAGDISVLVRGETGTGKEVVAEEIHRRSPRAKRPLLKLNCAALPEQLLESELFGHEKGAFTGAVAAKAGLLEEADGGTVFLDEIAELPAATQAKLLRVFEQREFLRVGALKSRTIDVRFIAATHRDLDAAIADGTFREDLYFRLGGITLEVPPLRERAGELDDLVARFATHTAAGLGRKSPMLSAAARALIHSYRWPGNVRELRNAIERATLLCDGTIEPEHLPVDRMERPVIAVTAVDGGLEGVKRTAEALERKAIEDALAAHEGNQTAAAKSLGISRRTMSNKLNQFGFERPRKR